ncbi:MAG: DNA polymerase III subunit delta' [Azospira oryzae]|uniref:DNA polymerase III subunit delta n=1 Tax=Pelomicrobium methylotrophicum TaxID=2602750 RepID=A0A5C7EPX2_9PROT|nr:DNA polymerase III subunit delta' [Pelomicrobium methylotrophicum]PZP64842.1 MAG: DNA polymerase III subunit delta' [Azospira oryzae]PZP82818.1 MAG: DNA polymerase III subunit delta' [Azospira oryzae]TXF13632.1 DNA polymerase III subunit delta' [Pelomicrobium methylotrophicum]
MIFHWHESFWRDLLGRLQARLPHALLFKGREGIGKLQLARALARYLLCENRAAEKACGACAGCRWFDLGVHPDYRILEPQAEAAEAAPEGRRTAAPRRAKRHITVEQIRDLEGFLEISAHRQGRKIVLIHPAEALNPSAAGALLKTLEEPPPGALFLLVSHHPRQLPATVLSRCVQVPVPVPAEAEFAAWLGEQGLADPELWLAEAGGAPLRAVLALNGDYRKQRAEVIRVLSAPPAIRPALDAERLEQVDLPQLVEWLYKWVYDLMAWVFMGTVRYNRDAAAEIRCLAPKADPVRAGEMAAALCAAHRSARHPLNARSFIEDLLLAYRGLFD